MVSLYVNFIMIAVYYKEGILIKRNIAQRCSLSTDFVTVLDSKAIWSSRGKGEENGFYIAGSGVASLSLSQFMHC